MSTRCEVHVLYMLNIVYLSPLSNSISHFVAANYNEKEQRIHSHFFGGCRWTNNDGVH